MPTSEPDPEAQRQPPVSTCAAALLLPCAYQDPTFAVGSIAVVPLLATYLLPLLLLPVVGSGYRFDSTAVFSPTRTRLRSDSGMDF